MGRLIEADTGRQITLPARTLVGRTRSADLMLEGRWISAEHAVIWWSPQGWRVKDLGSRNGTSVDGRRVVPPESCALVVGSQIAFGQAEAVWHLADAAAPAAQAVSESGVVRDSEDGVLVLPDEAHAWAVITHESGDWTIDDRHGRRRVLDRDVVRVGDQSWTLRLPRLEGPTGEAPGPTRVWSDATLSLRISRDQETVLAHLEFPDGAQVPLPHRAHHEVLLRLAERLAADREAGLAEAERGWFDADLLAQALGLAKDHVNVQISRLRKQLAQVGIADGHAVVERRAGAVRIQPLVVVLTYA